MEGCGMSHKVHTYSPAVLQIVSDMIHRAGKQTSPAVVAIAGGSCVGKSHTVSQFINEMIGSESTYLPQDDFQLGDDFAHKDSPYHWDDPRHFALDEYTQALRSLKNNKETTIPQFSLKENRRVGSKTLTPKKYIVCEGLYTFYQDLADECDVKVYLEATYYARLMRRLFRFVHHVRNEPEIPIRHMVFPTRLAHEAFVVTQRHQADIVINVPYSFTETRTQFSPKRVDDIPDGKAHTVYTSDDGVSILTVTAGEKNWLVIKESTVPILCATITHDMVQVLQTVDFEAL